MSPENSNEHPQARKGTFPWAGRLSGKAIPLMALFSLLAGSSRGFSAETSLAEYQVKALFLLNFAKYIEWPTNAFVSASAPITIGIIGEDMFEEHLKNAIERKNVNGRRLVIQPITKEEDWARCQILFISVSEKQRLDEILDRIKARPILTVGETEQFTQQGGVINFIRKEGKIRLEIDLSSARQAGLQISSKLLSVADVVRGKP